MKEPSRGSSSKPDKIPPLDRRAPNRYWLASTAFPLIAGTFGPVASAFNVCALSSNWREHVIHTGPPVPMTDPAWLLAINTISLASALIANGSLLLNMARRLSFVHAQPITISGFFLSSVLLIIDIVVLTASSTYYIPRDSDAAPAADHALTAAFYYAIMAAVIYALLAMLLCMTVLGAFRNYYAREFNLTVAQRTLMLQTMSFVIYLLLGAVVFSHIENWDYLDAVYWADVTLLTVGLGDITPDTHLGRALVMPYSLGGIVIIGLVIGSIRTMVLEKGRVEISARILDKRRSRAVKGVEATSTAAEHIRTGRFRKVRYDEASTDVAEKRRQEFEAMRDVQNCADREQKWMSLVVSTTAALTLWLVGAVVFTISERERKWTYFNALYFTYICLPTIGYGDFSPVSHPGRAFFVFWSLMAVPTLTFLIGDMSDTIVHLFSNLTIWVGSLTVLPDEHGLRATLKLTLKRLIRLEKHRLAAETWQHEPDEPQTIRDRVIARLSTHIDAQQLELEVELAEATDQHEEHRNLDHDRRFYHLVLARELQQLTRDLLAPPPAKRYDWAEWEYYLTLMSSNSDVPIPLPSKRARRSSGAETVPMVPEELRLPTSLALSAGTKHTGKDEEGDGGWTWLSAASPLADGSSETEWILERLSACLERELKDSRRAAARRHLDGGGRHEEVDKHERQEGEKRKPAEQKAHRRPSVAAQAHPPVRMADVVKRAKSEMERRRARRGGDGAIDGSERASDGESGGNKTGGEGKGELDAQWEAAQWHGVSEKV